MSDYYARCSRPLLEAGIQPNADAPVRWCLRCARADLEAAHGRSVVLAALAELERVALAAWVRGQFPVVRDPLG